MIGYIKGKIIGKGESYLLVENNGLGYRVVVTPATYEKNLGSDLELHTYLQVREDALNLFGFATVAELQFFELLITVSGVGPKMAMSVLSAGDIELIKNAIISEDIIVFTKIGGVGKKTAERITVELKEKLGALTNLTGGLSKSDEVLSALESLGYSNKEIKDSLLKVDRSLSSEEKIRQALKYLSN